MRSELMESRNGAQFNFLSLSVGSPDDLIIDTHGQPIIDLVYQLFEHTLSLMNKDVPVLPERDFNIPEMEELQKEIDQLRRI